MSSVYNDLPKKPLVEAILEIKWKLEQNRDPGHPLFVGLLAEKVSDRFPVQERLAAADAPDDLTPGIVKFRLRHAPETWPLVQAGPGVATLNMLSEYRWQDFRDLARYLWVNLAEAYKPFNSDSPPPVDRLQLRYINSVPLDGIDPQTFLREKLHVAFRLPQEIAEKEATGAVRDIALIVVYPINFKEATARVQFRSGKVNGEDAMLFELIADTRLDEPPDVEGFLQWLDYVHQTLEDWFFSLVDGELLTGFLGGESSDGTE